MDISSSETLSSKYSYSDWYKEIRKNNPDAQDERLFTTNSYDDIQIYINNPCSLSFYGELNKNHPVDQDHPLSFQWFMVASSN